MSLFTIVLFFIYCYGFGYSLTRSLANNRLETTVMGFGLGLGAFPFIGTLLNVLHCPLDWRIFLLLALALPVYDLILYRRSGKPLSLHLPELDWKGMALFFIIVINIIVYCGGAFVYPWLEDD